jgi:hypothetical protein
MEKGCQHSGMGREFCAPGYCCGKMKEKVRPSECLTIPAHHIGAGSPSAETASDDQPTEPAGSGVSVPAKGRLPSNAALARQGGRHGYGR